MHIDWLSMVWIQQLLCDRNSESYNCWMIPREACRKSTVKSLKSPWLKGFIILSAIPGFMKLLKMARRAVECFFSGKNGFGFWSVLKCGQAL